MADLRCLVLAATLALSPSLSSCVTIQSASKNDVSSKSLIKDKIIPGEILNYTVQNGVYSREQVDSRTIEVYELNRELADGKNVYLRACLFSDIRNDRAVKSQSITIKEVGGDRGIELSYFGWGLNNLHFEYVRDESGEINSHQLSEYGAFLLKSLEAKL